MLTAMANTVTSRKRLRIGILNDSVYSSKYVYELVEWGQSEPSLEISHLILHPNIRQGDKAQPHTKVGKLFKSLSRKGVLATFSIVLFRLLCLVEAIYPVSYTHLTLPTSD